MILRYLRSVPGGVATRVEMTADEAALRAAIRLDRGDRTTLRDVAESQAWSALSLAISALEGSDG